VPLIAAAQLTARRLNIRPAGNPQHSSDTGSDQSFLKDQRGFTVGRLKLRGRPGIAQNQVD
jgi:hypothetical protein